MKSLFATLLLLVLAGGCAPPAAPPSEAEISWANKSACVSKTQVEVGLGHALHETCFTTAVRVAQILNEDPACKEFFGHDFGVTPDELCGDL